MSKNYKSFAGFRLRSHDFVAVQRDSGCPFQEIVHICPLLQPPTLMVHVLTRVFYPCALTVVCSVSCRRERPFLAAQVPTDSTSILFSTLHPSRGLSNIALQLTSLGLSLSLMILMSFPFCYKWKSFLCVRESLRRDRNSTKQWPIYRTEDLVRKGVLLKKTFMPSVPSSPTWLVSCGSIRL